MPAVIYEIIKEKIAVITLNRPASANALSKDLLMKLNQIIKEIDENQAIYCTILTGSGNRSFCAGADLKERRNMSDEQVVTTVRQIGETVSNLENMRMPVIAALNGATYGGGLELALGCDFRMLVDCAKIGMTETSLAIIPGAGGTQRLPRLIGLGQAKQLIFTAIPITAVEALSIGLVEKIVAPKNLLQTALQIAENIAQNGPLALEQAKLAMNQGIQTDLTTGLTIEHQCYKNIIHTTDRIEGIHAFSEKRKPKYKGE